MFCFDIDLFLAVPRVLIPEPQTPCFGAAQEKVIEDFQSSFESGLEG